MSDLEKFAVGIGLTLVGFCLLLVLMGSTASSRTSVEIQGLTAHDLQRAVMRCTPLSATFEQELACYQAVYGGRK